MPRLDSTLASNAFTAYVPRLDSMAVHGIKYLAQQWAATMSDGLRALGMRSPAPNLAPRVPVAAGNAAGMNESMASGVRPGIVETLKCSETGRTHPVLPRERCDEIDMHMDAINASSGPTFALMYLRKSGTASAKVFTFDPSDGSTMTDAIGSKFIDANGVEEDLMPPSILQSSLLNRGLAAHVQGVIRDTEKQIRELDTKIANTDSGNEAEGLEHVRSQARQKEALESCRSLVGDRPISDVFPAGQITSKVPNSLADPKTGFVAGITVRNGTEVVINFGGMGSQSMIFRQGLRSFLNIIGMAPPKNFAQASKLTQVMKARIDEVNAKLPPGAPKFTLKVAGHSMGGAMATYAALRHQVPAVVIDPLRLGLGARAKVGRPALKAAPSLVTEVVVKGDWVSDTKKSRLWGFLHVPSLLLTGRRADAWGAIGQRYLVPGVEGKNPHADVYAILQAHKSGAAAQARSA